MSHFPEERPRILVVDDEKVIRDMLADFLGMEGYAVRTAEDGTSALGELQNWFGHTARNPNSNQSRNRQPKKSKNQVGALEAKIRRQFLVERSLQQRYGVCVLGRKRDVGRFSGYS